MTRDRRFLATALGGFLLFLAGNLLLLDRLYPPDLSRLAATARLVTDRHGQPLRVLATSDGVLRLPASLAEVDPRYLQFLLAYEDRRFRFHFGVDLLSLLRAAGQALLYGRIVSGGSTLTMQTARLLMPHERNLGGKLLEMLRALQLEWRFGKDEILGMYLTLAPMGGNLEGARIASLAYFGKEPRRLTAAEAALLVALPQSPERRRPDRAPEEARRGRQRVLDRLVARGVLSPSLATEAALAASPLGRRPLPFIAPHLAERLAEEAPQAVIASSLDRALQLSLEAPVLRQAAALGPSVGAAVIVVENEGRRVRAYVGSPDYFSLAREGAVDMVRVARSPGSTLKPFIYGLAFDRRLIHPLTRILDAPRSFRDYAPRNFDGRFRGEMTVAEALRQSLNVPAVAALDRVGPLAFAAALEQAGLPLVFHDPEARPSLALALGGTGFSLEQLVTLYAALADGGRVRPLSYLEAEGEAPGSVQPLMGRQAAEFLTLILSGVPPPAGYLREGDGIAYKTGTSYGYRDAWSIGYDDRHTVGVWVGRADGTPVPDSAGRRSAAPLLFAAFRLLNEGRPPRQRVSSSARAAAAEVPPALALFEAPLLAASTEGAARPALLAQPLAIAFPPPDSEVALKRREEGFAPLPLTVEGGRPPYRWLLDGRLLGESHHRPFPWQPQGPGFYDVSVIDAGGRTASRSVRLR